MILKKYETFKKTNILSLKSEIRIRTKSVELLSTPYMKKCIKYGMYSIDFIQTLNYFNQ